MFSQKQMTQWAKNACCALLIGLLTIGLVSCGGGKTPKTEETKEVSKPKPALTEVAPPAIFEELRQTLDNYQPQVSIISPNNGDIIEDTSVSIEVDVKDYPLFKNEELGMGPHLHVILDNEPYRAVYNADSPIVFEDLSPGTHTIRMFASRPWHESFKNEGAYAQVTFHLFTETENNNPDREKPLLTYSRPKGTYGAEPILLDYYLTNAPIRLFEQESDAEVEVNPASQKEWRVRATINGESFIMDSWLPVYLEGFKQGRNWIKLELLDGDGNLIANEFNTVARLFNYQPKGEDTLSKLVRGELTAEEARVIVDPDYQVPTEEEPAEEVEDTPTEPVEEEPAEEVEDTPTEPVEEEPAEEVEDTTPTEPAEEEPTEAVEEPAEPAEEETTEQVEETTPEPVEEEPTEQVEETTPEPVEEETTEQVEETTPEPVEEEPTEQVEETTPEPVEEEPAEQVEETTPEPVEEEPAEQVEETTPEPAEEETTEQVEDTTPAEPVEEEAIQEETPSSPPEEVTPEASEEQETVTEEETTSEAVTKKDSSLTAETETKTQTVQDIDK
ncbi:hypothetical protein [Euhalothece natronophila]|uniref:hypothetical protein n=1 Tax=Euhalothece natronophila TaxID=577489 RepID=UPI0016462847|nr:hypothetical protein [Euhalothece natronophila]